MTNVHPLLVNLVFDYFNIRDVPPPTPGKKRCFFKELSNDLLALIRFILPVAAKEMGYKLSPWPDLPWWAGVCVWRYVLWYFNAAEIPVGLCQLTANVKFRAFFNMECFDVYIGYFVLHTISFLL